MIGKLDSSIASDTRGTQLSLTAADLRARFVAMVAHEFRTPLAAIYSSAELLQDYSDQLPEQERTEVLNLIKGAVNRMNSMVDQVVMTSKLACGDLTLSLRPVLLETLLSETLAALTQAGEDSQRVVLRCGSHDQELQLDPVLLSPVILNLVTNALHFSGATRPVQVIADIRDGTLVVQIVDSGIGIAASDLPRMGEAFFRGANVGNIKGAGMGVHVAMVCLELHSGALQFDSEVGRGTTATVRIPSSAD